MKARRRWVQGYDAQVAVDENHVIVACGVSSAANGHRLLEPEGRARDETSAARGRPPSSSSTAATGTAKRSMAIFRIDLLEERASR